MVYFKYLFQHMEDLSPNEGLIYSELLLYSLTSNQAYKSGELLYIDQVKDVVANYKLLGWKESIDYYPLDIKELMRRTEMSFPTVRKAMDNLIEKGYIEGSDIRCPLDLLQKGYLKIPKGTKAKGKQLIFYGFLLNRSEKYKGIIDTWAYRFKELCGVDTDDAYFMIKQLKKKGLVERLEDGRLKINKPDRNKKGRNLPASSL
jgi:DNA-binding MarR family transcriptional regulator